MVFKYLPPSHAISAIEGRKKTLLNTLPAGATSAPSNGTPNELSIKTMIHQLALVLKLQLQEKKLLNLRKKQKFNKIEIIFNSTTFSSRRFLKKKYEI